jgi:PAS domain-containing protein
MAFATPAKAGSALDQPMVLATGMDGRFTYLNPSAERVLGAARDGAGRQAQMTEIFAPGEMERISQWLRKLHPSGKELTAGARPIPCATASTTFCSFRPASCAASICSCAQ